MSRMNDGGWKGIGELFIGITTILVVLVIFLSLRVEDLQNQNEELRNFIRDNQVPALEKK